MEAGDGAGPKSLIAAMRVVTAGGAADYWLRLAWQCRNWNCLPEVGGLLDQPAGLLDWMSAVHEVHRAFSVMASERPLMDVARSEPGVLRTVRRIEKLEVTHG